jgi:putative ubiquitin-RnfH superfamily antitoxin RatB of RatAB toxin-antitoxin module
MSCMPAGQLAVSLLWAGPGGVLQQDWSVADGTTVGDLRRLPDLHPDLARAWDDGHALARFGQVVELGARLEPWDRIDLVGPLVADPKDARRRRVEALRAERARQGQTDRWTKNRG